MVDLTTTGEHDLFLLLYGYSDPSILTYFFDPGRKGGSNRAWFSTDELTDLLTAADTQLDPELRYEAVTAVSEYIIEASPWVYLAVPPALTGVRAELENWADSSGLELLVLECLLRNGVVAFTPTLNPSPIKREGLRKLKSRYGAPLPSL